MTKDVIVIGAGIIGATTALKLAEQGYKVTIIDSANKSGQGASGANGAQLSYSYSDALASLDTLKSMPKLLLGLDSAFRLKPQFDIDFIKWGIDFIRNCSPSKSEANTLDVLKIGLRSQELLNAWKDKYNINFNHRKSGKLHLYESDKAFDKAKNKVDLKTEYGATQSSISYHEALELEPRLGKIKANYIGVVYTPGDEVGDVMAFTDASIQHAIRLGGGELLLNTKLIKLITHDNQCKSVITNQGEIEADHIVICAGYQTSKLAKQLGIKMAPIIPAAGYSLTYPATDNTPEISLTDTVNRIVLCRLGNELRVAGMADVGYVANTIPIKRINTLKQLLLDKYPSVGDYEVTGKSWAGTRPMTADSRPIICRTKYNNVYVNSGHGMLGWTLAAGSAEILSNLIKAS